MNTNNTIFFPELVPLENKGEEAVVRGVADLMYPGAGESVRIGVLDFVPEPVNVDGITVFPIDWLYAGLYRGTTRSRTNYARPKRPGPTQRLHDHAVLLRVVLGQPGPAGCLSATRHPVKQPLLDFFRESDFVFVGHDGLWGPETYLTLKAAKAAGKRAGMVGTGLRQGSGKLRWIHRLAQQRGVMLSDFCIVREMSTYNLVRSLCPEAKHIALAPDPAFVLNPDSETQANEVLSTLPGVGKARARGSLLVMATVAENSVVFNQSFKGAKTFTERRHMHNTYLAHLFDMLIERENAHIVMLPHSHHLPEIRSPSFNNDILVARGVVSYMRHQDSVEILDEPLSCRRLKALTREADLVVGERTHSLIGSVGVGTPFVGLTNTSDHRTQGIITDMCQCQDQMVNMDQMSVDQACQIANNVLRNREAIRKHLLQKSSQLSATLEQAAHCIRTGTDPSAVLDPPLAVTATNSSAP